MSTVTCGHFRTEEGTMDVDEYQSRTTETAIFPDELPEFLDIGQVYVVLGTGGETGEVQDKLKKAIREGDPEYIETMREEIGDGMWYYAQVCEQFGWSLEEILRENLEKLQDRQERGVLTGEGDDR